MARRVNQDVAERLDGAARLFHDQGADPFRVSPRPIAPVRPSAHGLR
jgi:hypothetical protein